MLSDAGKIIRSVVIVMLLTGLSFGANTVFQAFRKAPVTPVASNDDAVDFSGPASKNKANYRTQEAAAIAGAAGQTRQLSSASPHYVGDSGSYAEAPREDSSGGIYAPQGGGNAIESIPGMTSASGPGAFNSLSGSSSPGGTASGSGSSTGSNSSTSTDSGLGYGGGVPLTGSTGSSGTVSTIGTGTTSTAGTTTTATTTGVTTFGLSSGGVSDAVTAGGYRASVSIGMPLSAVSGTTTGGYQYQLNIAGQQAQ